MVFLLLLVQGRVGGRTACRRPSSPVACNSGPCC